MAQTLEQIQKQIADLQRQAEKIRRDEVGEVIGRIKEAIALYGFTAADLGLRKAPRGRPASKTSKPRKKASRAKFRDASGRTWTGRGRRPQWFIDALAAGKTPEDLRA
jgi:DNA-binding protein H-NS